MGSRFFRLSRWALLVALLLALLAGFAARPPAAHAANITVAASEVAILENNVCSLREAITNANADAQTYDDCAAGSGADTITLASSTYNIGDSVGAYLFGNNGTPAVTSVITIEGSGATINRSAGSLRLLLVTSGGNLTLNDLSLTNGAMDSDRGGGAVHNNLSTLTLNDVTLSGNSGNNSSFGGGAISAEGGTTTVNSSTFSNNQGGGGGAIAVNNGGVLNVTDSTFTGNTAANNTGGAIRGTYTGSNAITITGSTLNGNSANSGGAIGLGAGTLIVTNSTISGNTAQSNGGGIDAGNTTVTLNNVTITGNTAGAGGGGGGGGIYSNTTINFNRSIVSGNSGPNYDAGYEVAGNGTENANNYNVFGRDGINNARAFAYSFTPGANDVNATDDGTNTPIASILNATLANNGGPTKTHALVAGSPAVDRAPSADCTAAPISGVDQRGYPRNVDGNAAASANECDAGAYEYLSSPPPTTGTIVIVKDADPADDTGFSFTENIENTGFTLTDPSDNTKTFANVPAGSYTVTEDGETGWTLDDLVCDDANSTESVGTKTATINLEAGETVTCTFSNSRDTGTVVIVKDATPADDTAFSFTENILSTGFTLMDPSDDTETFTDVPTGSYTVTEDGETGWTLDDITCDDANSTGNTGTGAATINVEKDETVTCTFSNSRDTGTVVIVKSATPADDTPFGFTENIVGPGFSLMDPSDDTKTFSNVPTGSYSVVENTPAPWLLDDIDCDDANSIESEATATATINVEKGETVTCTFYNSNTPPPSADVFVSAKSVGVTGDGLAFGPHDILKWDGSAWSKWFDGSAAGLVPSGIAQHHVYAFWIPDPAQDDVVMSFTHNRRVVPGIPGFVDGMDLVWWDGSTFSLWFDGQDVGLTVLTQEKIDALHVLDGSLAPPALAAASGGSCLNYLLISTQGPGRVPNYDATTLKFGGEDVLGFCLTQSGDTTQGNWIMVLDGSAEGMPRGSTEGLSASADGQTLYLTTRGTFNVDAATGGHSMVYEYDFATGQFSGPIFSAPAAGLPRKVTGLQY